MARTYRVGVIGRTGRGDYGHNLDTVWQRIPETQIVAVSDDDKMGLAKAAERLKVSETYTDYRELLDKAKPDIVSVCPRWIDQHRDMIIAAAERGIHMYVEKPLCRTLAEADEIIDACERTHTKLVVAHQTRYSPMLAMVKKLISDGAIGQVLEYRGRGKEDPRGGAEDLWVLGSHILDMIRFLSGDANWCFATMSQGDRPVEKADVHDGPEGLGPLAGDALQAMYGMQDGTTAYFSSRAKAGNGKRFGLQIYGSSGVLEILMGYMPKVSYLKDPAWSPARSKAKWQNVSSTGIEQPEPITDGSIDQGNVAAVRDLLASIEENRLPSSNMYTARAVTEMILAVFESHRIASRVPLPMKNRQHPLTMLA